MHLLYDPRDDAYHEQVGSQILYWLDDLGAIPLSEATADSDGFLFAGARPIDDYRALVSRFPLIRDRPEEREPLLRLDSVLKTLEIASVHVPSPKTWTLPLDAPLPRDLTFPLFVRTSFSSWKRGGTISKVESPSELEAESAELRRAFGWDTPILAREWLNLDPAGEARCGPVPQEVRTWSVDGLCIAWSFHYSHLVPQPKGFPPSASDLSHLRRLTTAITSAFRSRLIVTDFARACDGNWWFIEAGPGSCAGTAQEAVFKSVARRLCGDEFELQGDQVGGPL